MTKRFITRLLALATAAVLAACGGEDPPPAAPAASSSATTTPPSSPTSLRLDWSANTESDLAGYRIYRSTTSGNYGAPVATVSPSATSYVATGLKPGVKYFFTITAFDKTGNEIVKSVEVSGAL